MKPSFFVLGAQKAGTTALHHYLAQHPDIFLPAIKETHFFNDGHEEFSQGDAFYLEKYFRQAQDGQIAGEVDPEYLYFPECPRRIAEHNPDARLIFIFRDPVMRAHSHYWMNVRRGWETLSFAEAVGQEEVRLDEARPLWPRNKAWSRFSYVDRGFYWKQVKRYLEFFPQEHMFFLLSDELAVDPSAVVAQLHAFIGVEPRPPEPLESGQRNQSAQTKSSMVRDLINQPSVFKRMARKVLPRSVRASIWGAADRWNTKPMQTPPLDPGLEKWLRQRLKPDIEELAKSIERDLSAWTRMESDL